MVITGIDVEGNVSTKEFSSFVALYMCPEKFEWKPPPYEYEFKRPPIDIIFGADWVRRAIEAKGGIRRSSLVARKHRSRRHEAGKI